MSSGVVQVARRASAQAPNLARDARRRRETSRVHIYLRGLPRTALPADIRRLLARERVEHVSDVSLDYHQFIPTGRAVLTVTHPDFLLSNLSALKQTSLSGLPVTAVSSSTPASLGMRTRGAQGAIDALNRGIVSGNGPNGGLRSHEKNVVMWGLPGKLTSEGLQSYLTGFKLLGDAGQERSIVQIEKPEKQFSLYSRYLVRLVSSSEAHRLVRKVHRTYFESSLWGFRYQIHARLIY